MVALAAAFIGALATIMFGNSVYTTYISKQAEDKAKSHEKFIPDLYVLTLNNEAHESEKEGDILRAIEFRIGVIHFFLKSSYASRTEILNNYLQALNKAVRSLNPHDLIYYFNRLNLNRKTIIQEIIDSNSDIHRRIAELGELDNGFLVKPNMDRIKKYVDKQVKRAIDTIKSEEEIPKFKQSNDYRMHI